jgi:hypothetical protein
MSSRLENSFYHKVAFIMKAKSVQSVYPCLSGRQACQSVIQTIFDIVKAQTMDAKSEKELETEFRIHYIFNY